MATTNEEASAIDNLMCRYSYALAFFAEKENQGNYLLNSFLTIPGNEKDILPDPALYKDILKVFYDGWK